MGEPMPPFDLSFQSTLSVRRATIERRSGGINGTISIHALREESDKGMELVDGDFMISIHALREESDLPAELQGLGGKNFNPRSP